MADKSLKEEDLKRAREIVGTAPFIVGRGGTMRETVAKLVARGIAEGRRQAEQRRKDDA